MENFSKILIMLLILGVGLILGLIAEARQKRKTRKEILDLAIDYEDVNPANKLPTPRGIELEDGKPRKWTFEEIAIAIYCLKMEIELIPYSKSYIAKCIGRTPGAMLRKGYRALSGEPSDQVQEILNSFHRGSQQQRLKQFYFFLYFATRKHDQEVSDFFFDKFEEISLREA